MEYINVTAAVIRKDGRYLIARRPEGSHLAGKWEFPGGKIEQGEIPEECLKRELHEEFHIDTEIGDFICESCFDYRTKRIRLLAYDVTYLTGEFVLNDHDRIEWIKLDQFANFEMAPADIPIVEALENEEGKRKSEEQEH